MKRKIFKFLAIAVLLTTAIIACKKPVDGVNIDRDLLLLVGETAILIPSFIPPDAHNQKVSWESSDPSVATVDNGNVTGIKVGRAIITVKTEDGGRTAKCFVSVTQPIEPEMVWVEGGTFTMGCTDEQGEDCYNDELPSHQITLSGFYIGKYEITQKEWVAAMGDNPSLKNGDKIPVHCIGLGKVQEYINRLNAVTGKDYRLPTEAEWEYAARGGNKSEGYKYSGSNNVHEVAWCDFISGGPFNVGTKKANELGIYDMSGNVLS
jgi:formylglycine-generating enzyme required for sulfatase activity